MLVFECLKELLEQTLTAPALQRVADGLVDLARQCLVVGLEFFDEVGVE